MEQIQIFIKPIDVYSRSSIYYPLSTKIVYDIISALNDNLVFVKSFEINEYFSILIFEKPAQ